MLLKEFMVSKVRQISSDRNYAVAAKGWLAVKLLARLGNRVSLRVAALLMRNKGWN